MGILRKEVLPRIYPAIGEVTAPAPGDEDLQAHLGAHLEHAYGEPPIGRTDRAEQAARATAHHQDVRGVRHERPLLKERSKYTG